MREVVVIGLTGGVGAGKSTVIGYLKEKYNALILVADLIGASMMEPGGATHDGIAQIVGQDILLPDGTIDKRLMAAKMYADDDMRQRVNAFVHPKVVDYLKNKIEQEHLEAAISREDGPRIVVIESAIIFEGGASELCDEIWYVRTDPEVRIKRLMESRGYSREKCLDIMKAQTEDEVFLEKCHRVIDNSADAEYTHESVDIAMKNILETEEI